MANITTQTIRVDLSTDKVLPTAFTHQNDTARTLVFDMYNGGMPYTMTGNTVKFAYKSPIVNGQYSVIAGASMESGTVSGNKVSVTLPVAYTAISGVGMLTMVITPTSGTVRPVNIRLVVQKSADGDDTIAGASDFPDAWMDEKVYSWLDDHIDGIFTEEQFNGAIDNWLDDHPEATTTVQDGAITEAKLVQSLKNKINTTRSDLDKITNNIIPSDDTMEAYKENVTQCAVSYLVRSPYRDCFESGDTVTDEHPIVFKYDTNDDKGYRGLYTSYDGIFSVADTLTVDGVLRNVGYLDCSMFVTLLTKNIPYEESPYAYALANPNATYTELLNALKTKDTPNALDFQNDPITWRMARMMDASGNKVKPLIERTSEGYTINEDVFDTLESGDLLFVGDTTSTNYLGIHHVAIYFRTLDELNEYAREYGVVLKSAIYDSNVETGDYGYYVHCTSSTDSIRIQTLMYELAVPLRSNKMTIYTCKPYANNLNTSNAIINQRNSYVQSVSITGKDMAVDSDMDLLKVNGIWKVVQDGRNIKNLPPNVSQGFSKFKSINFGFDSNGYSGTQIVFPYNSENPSPYMRYATYGSGSFTEWAQFLSTLNIKHVRESLSANSTNTVFDLGWITANKSTIHLIILHPASTDNGCGSIYFLRQNSSGTLRMDTVHEGTGSAAPRITSTGVVKLNTSTTEVNVHALIVNLMI